jgi:hypothetical protein
MDIMDLMDQNTCSHPVSNLLSRQDLPKRHPPFTNKSTRQALWEYMNAYLKDPKPLKNSSKFCSCQEHTKQHKREHAGNNEMNRFVVNAFPHREVPIASCSIHLRTYSDKFHPIAKNLSTYQVVFH